MKPKELTLRGLVLGALITTVFTAANVYLGLKVGLTFASSIAIPGNSLATFLASSRKRPSVARTTFALWTIVTFLRPCFTWM